MVGANRIGQKGWAAWSARAETGTWEYCLSKTAMGWSPVGKSQRTPIETSNADSLPHHCAATVLQRLAPATSPHRTQNQRPNLSASCLSDCSSGGPRCTSDRGPAQGLHHDLAPCRLYGR